MAVDFASVSWADEIAAISELEEFQTCQIRIENYAETLTAYDYTTNDMYQVSPSVNALSLAVINSDPGQETEEAIEDLLVFLELPVDSDVQVGGSAPDDEEALWVRKIDKYGVPFQFDGGWGAIPVNATVYEGRARFIPVRAGVWQGGEAQANASTIRAVRFQIPHANVSKRVNAGSIITIIKAKFNPSLNGRTAKSNDDFQGATAASRTIHATMDADSEDIDES